MITVAQKNDFKMRIWSINDDAIIPIDEFPGHDDCIKSFDWRISSTSDGKDPFFQVVSLSQDQSIKIWPVDHLLLEDCGASKFAYSVSESKDPVNSSLTDKAIPNPTQEENPFKREYQGLLENMASVIDVSAVSCGNWMCS